MHSHALREPDVNLSNSSGPSRPIADTVVQRASRSGCGTRIRHNHVPARLLYARSLEYFRTIPMQAAALRETDFFKNRF